MNGKYLCALNLTLSWKWSVNIIMRKNKLVNCSVFTLWMENYIYYVLYKCVLKPHFITETRCFTRKYMYWKVVTMKSSPNYSYIPIITSSIPIDPFTWVNNQQKILNLIFCMDGKMITLSNILFAEYFDILKNT